MTEVSRAGRAALALALAGFASTALAREPPRRVVSINLAADEILLEILPLDRLLAVTRFVDEAGSSNVIGRVPDSVARIPRADMEQIVALSPDLVVVSEYTDADFLELLGRSGLRHHRMRGLTSLGGIRTAMLELGRAVGCEDAARTLVDRYDETLQDLGRRLEGAQRPRVLYWSNGMTAGAHTAIGAIVEAAGGDNVGRQLGLEGIVPLGAERAFVSDPDVVLVGTWPGAVESVRDSPLLSKLRAVRERRIVQMPTELLVALSQYTAEACWQLAARLHPERVPRDRR